MFYECRIYDKQGKLKRVFSPEELEEKSWKEFNKNKGLTNNQKYIKARKELKKMYG